MFLKERRRGRERDKGEDGRREGVKMVGGKGGRWQEGRGEDGRREGVKMVGGKGEDGRREGVKVTHTYV